MRVEKVEIYSDETNSAVMRHPGRRFPGVLVQGDSLHALCQAADHACAAAHATLDRESYEQLNRLRNSLWGHLNHYKAVLGAHEIALPFNEST